MRSRAGGLSKMANGAIIDRSRVTLQLHEFDSIICFAAGGDGMRTVMAGFAVHPSMSGRKAV